MNNNDDDDDESNKSDNFNDIENNKTNIFDPDEEFKDEFGYKLIKSLRGKTCGRKTKRTLFKFGFIQFLCGIPLLILSILESKNFDFFYFFNIINNEK
jgi:hypothetical protein